MVGIRVGSAEICPDAYSVEKPNPRMQRACRLKTQEKSLNQKTVLKGMSLPELEDWCAQHNQTRYRAVQLYEWMYRHGAADADAMTNITRRFREYLAENVSFETLDAAKISVSEDEPTRKILFRTADDQYIEAVSMIDGNRHTVCISSQVGCNVGCTFCATGTMGLKRNLSAGEIVDQLIWVRAHSDQSITNVVFMGMGEPFLNYDNVMTAADIFHNERGFNLGANRITLSTAGIIPGIERFLDEGRRYKLAISLNAPDDEIRSRIMPVTRKWPINELLRIAKIIANQKKRLVMFEYVMLKDINDSEEAAWKLVRLLKGIQCKINLIPYNESDGLFQRPDSARIERFARIMYDNQSEYRVLVRWSKGQDIAAACGQLAAGSC